MTDVNHTITLGMRMCIDQGLYRKTYTRHMSPQSIPLLIPVKMTLDGNIDTFMLLLEDWCEVMIAYNKQKFNPGGLLHNEIISKSDSGTKCAILSTDYLTIVSVLWMLRILLVNT